MRDFDFIVSPAKLLTPEIVQMVSSIHEHKGKQELYDDVIYWDYNWRKAGGSQRMIEISKRERFYQQEYCGCVYSLRDSNKWREETGRQKIEIGKLYYTPD